MMRRSLVKRKTRETTINAGVRIDGTGSAKIVTGIGFFDHLLESFAKHGLFDIVLVAKGDLHVDQHHTVEDTGLALGKAFDRALGARKGIERAGCFVFPMDEALAYCAIDLSGRPFLRMQGSFRGRTIGELECALLQDFFQGFATALKANIHIKILTGRSDHHKAEVMFKACAKALKQACTIVPRARKKIPSTKGKL
ncbi:imidazoleglycerol-phosphate dehydratase HisB [candidate division WOR-3 bacterium]|nr:imidazoleglycerol-phosphate dehydratase HisB [candidate division WOR-3 bacterium]